MRLGIALLRSTNVTQLEFELMVSYLEYCCKWYNEDNLWPEEAHCPYREECASRFEGNIYLEIKPTKGGRMAIKKPTTTTLYTVREVADILDCKQSHVMKLIRSSALKAEKHGWVWAISSDDLEAYRKKNS